MSYKEISIKTLNEEKIYLFTADIYYLLLKNTIIGEIPVNTKLVNVFCIYGLALPKGDTLFIFADTMHDVARQLSKYSLFRRIFISPNKIICITCGKMFSRERVCDCQKSEEDWERVAFFWLFYQNLEIKKIVLLRLI